MGRGRYSVGKEGIKKGEKSGKKVLTREEVFANISKRSAAGASPAGERRDPHEAVQGTEEKSLKLAKKSA